MSYKALYRVWRPKQFNDLIGQEHVTKTLKNAIAQGKLSHAYLFTGPRGTGKTSAAKIVAKAVNCEQPEASEPCNECTNCKELMSGASPDVLEIDAASNNGVDEIRDLREKVKFAPSRAMNKVYIIDEVHMLTTGAFNALLKTLEEPPEHVIFILATTEPHKVPLTIISRCQRFDFRPVPNKAMISRLEMIVRKEGMNIDNEALYSIVRTAEGGMRDALSILDQAISYSSSEKHISEEDVLAVTGAVPISFLSNVVTAIVTKDIEAVLKAVDRLLETGKDPVRFIEDLIHYFRDLLLFQTVPNLEEVSERITIDDQFEEVAKRVSSAWIYSMIDALNKGQQEMKWTNNKRILLEVVLIKLCQQREQNETTYLLEKIESLETALVQMQRENEQVKKEETVTPPQQNVALSSKQGKKQSLVQVERLLSQASKRELQRLRENWNDIMENIRREKISAHAWLKESKPVACSEHTFLLAFPYEMHSQMASTDQIRQPVEQVVAKIMKRPLTMVTIVETDWEKVKQTYVTNQQTRGDSPAHFNENSEDPLIAEAKKLFGEELIEIKN